MLKERLMTTETEQAALMLLYTRLSISLDTKRQYEGVVWWKLQRQASPCPSKQAAKSHIISIRSFGRFNGLSSSKPRRHCVESIQSQLEDIPDTPDCIVMGPELQQYPSRPSPIITGRVAMLSKRRWTL